MFKEKNMNNKKNTITVIITFIGLILAIWLCKIYYDANFNPYALGSFCSVNDFVDCDGVAKTEYSQFLGIPLCLWGTILYLFILVLLFAEKLSKIFLFKFLEVFKNPNAYIFCLSSLAFVISMCLACISLFAINKICILCFTTYFVDLAIALISKDFQKSVLYEIKQSFSDFIDAIKIKKYLIAFIVVITIFAGILTYTEKSKILTPQLKKFDISVLKANGFNNDNTIGNSNAKVVIQEYMDYNCASCYIMNLSLKRAATELNDIYIVQYNMPLDGECNPLVTKGHEGSCQMARYALAAKKQGKYWEANAILFEKTPTAEKDIIRLLSTIKGLDKKQLIADAQSDEIKNELKEEIEKGLKQKIDATPTTIINLKKQTGNIPYNTLKERLLSAGATEKVEQ